MPLKPPEREDQAPVWEYDELPLATVVVGGMLVGPILLLVVVPAVRMLFLGRRQDPEPWTPAATGSFEASEPKLPVHADDS